MEDPLPPYDGIALPLPGLSEASSPLASLVEKLYALPEEEAGVHVSTFQGELEHFSMAHENEILREPFVGAGTMSRPCLLGDSCMGKHKHLPGHAASGGVILTELMTPGELAAFKETGEPPSERRVCLLCARYQVHSAYLFARKKRTFPPNALLNHFVNAGGEGEYSEEYLIPSADDSSWSGVVGTVAGLHLNALRLVQHPDRSWHVDQSAMAHITRTACNFSFPQLYRGLVQTPNAYLRAFFTHRARVVDAPLLFFSYEELCEARPKLGQPSTDEFLQWPPQATKSFLHRLLFYRVNRLNQMLIECSPLYEKPWAYNMQLYIDAHVGMALLFERGETLTTWALKYTAHEQVLPDLVALSVQAAVNSVVPAGLSVSDRKKEMAKPRALAAQMLIRALPEFCQTRWLHALFLRCLQNRELSSTMFSIAQAALLGNYSNVQGPPAPYATRKAIIAEFTQKTATQIFCSLPANEHLVLYIMGTYMLTILPLCPALENLVVAMSPFQSQAARVFDAMQAVRHAARDDWRLLFSTEVLESLKKTHKRMPKRKTVPRGLSDCSSVLLTTVTRSASRRGLKRSCGVAFDSRVFGEHVKRARQGLPPPPAVALPAQGVAEELSRLYDEDSSKLMMALFPVSTISSPALMELADFAAATDHAKLVRLTALPSAFVGAQVAAVARRFGCEASDWECVRRATRVAICVNCGIRNFFLLQQERGASSRRVDNVRAAGYRKLALNLSSGELRCVASSTCHQHELTYVDLAGPGDPEPQGGVLVLRGCSVMVSPCCGHLCATSAIRVTPTGMDCPACATSRREAAEKTPDPRICAHCSKRSQLRQAMDHTVLLRDELGRVQCFGFCKSHFRQWARTQSGYLDLDFVSKNIGNRSGNGLVLNPT